MNDTIQMILGWSIIPIILFVSTTIEPLGLLLGYLVAILASIYGIIVIGMMLMALAAVILSPFLLNDNN